MVIYNGTENEQSIVNVLENMVPSAMPDAEMILHTMLCCSGIMRWDRRRRIILDGHTIPNTDIAELLEYVVLPYHKDIPKPQGIDNFIEGLSDIGVDPRHIGNQCVRLVVESKNEVAQSMDDSYPDSLVVEPDVNQRDNSF